MDLIRQALAWLAGVIALTLYENVGLGEAVWLMVGIWACINVIRAWREARLDYRVARDKPLSEATVGLAESDARALMWLMLAQLTLTLLVGVPATLTPPRLTFDGEIPLTTLIGTPALILAQVLLAAVSDRMVRGRERYIELLRRQRSLHGDQP